MKHLRWLNWSVRSPKESTTNTGVNSGCFTHQDDEPSGLHSSRIQRTVPVSRRMAGKVEGDAKLLNCTKVHLTTVNCECREQVRWVPPCDCYL